METDRLLLRPWAADDVDPLAAIFAEGEVWRFPFDRGLTREETERFLQRQIEHWDVHGFGMWAAESKDANALIGYIGLAVPTWLPQVLPAVEVGWRLHPDFWGRGLATEGGRAGLRYGFEALGLDRIISIFTPENVASGRVMTKLGFRDVLTTQDPVRKTELTVREITRAEWEATSSGS